MHPTIEGEDKHVESRLIPRLDESSNLSISTETRKQKPNQEVQRERLGTPFSREQTIFIERDEKSSIEEWKKREKEDVLKMRDFRKERKPEIKIHTKEVRKKTF